MAAKWGWRYTGKRDVEVCLYYGSISSGIYFHLLIQNKAHFDESDDLRKNYKDLQLTLFSKGSRPTLGPTQPRIQ
jgi:hypothetical protein